MLILPSQRHRAQTRAWTLTELMFVIGIMVALAALVAGSIGPVKAIAAKQHTKGILRVVETGLARYQAEYGSFPICEDVNEGAEILYTSLYGDYNQNGIPDHDDDDPASSSSQDVVTFIPDLQPPEEGPNGEPIGGGTKYVGGNSRDGYFVKDSWGNPIFYACYPKGSTEAPTGGGKHNPTYDLFSLANDNTGNMEERWIKNW